MSLRPAPLLALLLAGCAASPESGLQALTPPEAVSVAYSEFNLQISLVTARTGPAALDARDAFDQRVARLGGALAESAFAQYPLLRRRFDKFEFIIADKDELGTVSSAAGRIAVLRPVGSIAEADAALAFVLAREMGHIVADHHAENAGASLAISGIALLLFPITGLANAIGSIFAPAASTAAASSAATLTANLTATAASFVGQKLVVRSYQGTQVEEADTIALQLLAPLCFTPAPIAAALGAAKFPDNANDWTKSLQDSIKRLAAADARRGQVQLGRDDHGHCHEPKPVEGRKT